MANTNPEPKPAQKLLHLVFGGGLTSVAGHEFKHLGKIDIFGIYPNYAEYGQTDRRSRGKV